jgi:hypothetical protein
MLLFYVSCFMFITFVCASLAAQGPQIAIVQRSPIVEPANGPAKGLAKIHSNLGSKTDAFDDGVSWSITGPDNLRWGEGYLAMPFTPKANSTAKEVLIALGYVTGGFNKGSISIFTDAGGVPGKPLKTWATGDFPREGQCCKMIELKNSAGVPLIIRAALNIGSWPIPARNQKKRNTNGTLFGTTPRARSRS